MSGNDFYEKFVPQFISDCELLFSHWLTEEELTFLKKDEDWGLNENLAGVLDEGTHDSFGRNCYQSVGKNEDGSFNYPLEWLTSHWISRQEYLNDENK